MYDDPVGRRLDGTVGKALVPGFERVTMMDRELAREPWLTDVG